MLAIPSADSRLAAVRATGSIAGSRPARLNSDANGASAPTHAPAASRCSASAKTPNAHAVPPGATERERREQQPGEHSGGRERASAIAAGVPMQCDRHPHAERERDHRAYDRQASEPRRTNGRADGVLPRQPAHRRCRERQPQRAGSERDRDRGRGPAQKRALERDARARDARFPQRRAHYAGDEHDAAEQRQQRGEVHGAGGG
jgi:hypothetical protein